MITFKQFMSEDTLDDLQLELAFMKEFGLKQEDAEQAAEWLRADRDSQDLDCWDDIWSRWEDKLDEYEGDGDGFRDFVFSMVCEIMIEKYGIEL